MKTYSPDVGDRRVRHTLCLIPQLIGNYWYWLRPLKVKQEFGDRRSIYDKWYGIEVLTDYYVVFWNYLLRKLKDKKVRHANS